jgi:hypothetical protein
MVIIMIVFTIMETPSLTTVKGEPGSSEGISTDYGLDGPGIESGGGGGGEIFGTRP